VLNGKRVTKTTATLDTKSSLTVYKMELTRLQKNIAYNLLELQTTKDKDIEYEILLTLLSDINNFNKHKIIATLLDGKNLPNIDITIASIKSKLQNLEQKIPTIKLVAKVLTKDINEKNIYLSAIKPSQSKEVTQFAKILKNIMSTKLSIAKHSSDADYFLRGNYEILKDSIFITMYLSDTKNNILKTITATVDKSAYKSIYYKPKTKSFDESLDSGFIKSFKFS